MTRVQRRARRRAVRAMCREAFARRRPYGVHPDVWRFLMRHMVGHRQQNRRGHVVNSALLPYAAR